MTAITDKRVQVYYNIRRGDYSVRQSGRVIDHVDTIILRDCRFNVAPAGRDKVRATGVKNVHATVSGYIDESVKISRVSLLYKCDDFLELIDATDRLATRLPIHPYPGVSQPVVYNPKRKIRAWGVK